MFIRSGLIAFIFFIIGATVHLDFKNYNLRLKEALSGKLPENLEETTAPAKNYPNVFEEIAGEFSQLKQRVDRNSLVMKSLYKVSLDTSSIMDLEDLLESIVAQSLKVMEAKNCSLMLIDKKENCLRIKTAIGLSKDIIENTRVPIGSGISGWVARSGQPLLVKNIEEDPRFGKKVSDSKYETKSLISVPLKIKDNVIGVINVNNKLSGESFTEEDLDIMTIFANYATVSLEQARLYENLNQHYMNIVTMATRALEAKDPYTMGHSERVTQYAVEIGQMMNLPKKQIRILEQAGLLHDIGKIGISESILLKKGRLTDEEFEIIKRHPQIGVNIIEPMNVHPMVRSAVLHHHERYDGRGYPDGLKGNDIPQAARILCVADSFDAMTSTRPYRPALSSDVVISELKKNSGTQFDGEIVKIFLEILKKRKYYSED